MSTVSIVIPTKNEEEYLPKLLLSLEKQTLLPKEVIIADAKSEDRTCEIAHAFGAKVTEGGMPSIGRNAGAELASGDIILFLDADVILLDTRFIERAVTHFNQSKLDFATADLASFDGKTVDHLMYGIYNHYVHFWGGKNAHAAGCCMMVRRDLHQKIGGFDESVCFCEDADYAKRAATHGRFGFLPEPIHSSIRRMERDGRALIALKMVLAELHLLFIGPIRKDYFRYSFGYPRKSYEEE